MSRGRSGEGVREGREEEGRVKGSGEGVEKGREEGRGVREEEWGMGSEGVRG